MKEGIANIIFDLDGTLIDSSPSILATFRDVLESNKVEPRVVIDSTIIGPPLVDTLRSITGIDDAARLLGLAEAFKFRYDSVGVLQTRAYPGIVDMLDRLRTWGYSLYIATNKRLTPTVRILRNLRLWEYFDAVYTIDIATPPYAGKNAMIAALLSQKNISSESGCYVGDRPEDGFAADANGLAFIAVDWGYGSWSVASRFNHWEIVDKPSMLALRFGYYADKP